MTARSRSVLTDGGEWILNTIKQNPEGLLLIAAGAVLMMRTVPQSDSAKSIASAYDRDPSNPAPQRSAGATQTMANAARQTMDVASSYASSASDTARKTMDATKSYASSASDYVGQARRSISEQSERIAEQTQSFAEGVMQKQPLVIALAGLAAGAAVAATFPPTHLEKQTLGPVGDEMSKAAERVGGQLKQATMKAGETLKSAADDRGLHAEGLKEVASEVIDTFKSSMAGQPDKKSESIPSAQRSGGSSDRSW